MSSKPHDQTVGNPKHTEPTPASRSHLGRKPRCGRPSPTAPGLGGTARSTQNNPKHMAGHCFPGTRSPHRLPLLYPGGIPPPRSSGKFSACWAHSFGGLPETPVIRRDNMSGLKNWAVLGSGHFRYRKLSPPATFEGRFHPFLTHFLRGEPDSIF